jgi:hypothetical protein
MESDYLEKWFNVWNSTLFYKVSGALTTAPENPRESDLFRTQTHAT